MSSRSDLSDWSRHSRWDRWHQEEGAHMKINLPVFKDKDDKDVVTYQSWRWDLTVYRHAGWQWLHPLTLCNKILARLSWRAGMELWYRYKLGCLPFKAFAGFSHFLLWPFSPRLCGRAEEGSLLWWTSQVIKSNGSLPEGRSTGENIFRLPKGNQGGQEIRLNRVVPELQKLDCQWPPNWGLLSSSPWGNLRVTNHFWKSLLFTWHMGRKRMQMMVKTQRVMILVESRGWLQSSWSNWQGQWRIPKQMRNAVTIVAALNISPIIAHLWRPLEPQNS